MLHYSVDNEIMNDLYRDFRRLKGADMEQLHQLGQQYLPLTEAYDLNEKTIEIIRQLCGFETEEQRDEIETGIIHGYLMAKADLRREQADYREFLELFDGGERQALMGLSEYVLGKKRIPYKIKNRGLHIDVLSTPAMSLELDFENVLIEDGRHPREIIFTHLAGERFEREETVRHEDGTEEKVTAVRYRLRFINGLSEGPYQAKESAFVFTALKGSLHLYDYNTCAGPLDVNADKLPWRLVVSPMEAMLEKARILGVETLNAAELSALPFLCVFYELIQFYLAPTTEAGIGRSLIHYDDELAVNFAFSQSDLDAACQYLRDCEQPELEMLVEWLGKAVTDRAAFCRYWIQFASTKRAEALYKILTQTVEKCSGYYERRALSLASRKHRGTVRRVLNEYFSHRKWRGEYPHFRRVESPNFLEVSNVYRQMYTYINEKQKAYYVDFIEGVTEASYTVTALTGYVLLQDGENARDYRALHGYFMDGGRRVSHIVGQIAIDATMDSSQVTELLNAMLEDVEKELQHR